MDAVARHTVPRLRAYVNLLTPSEIYLLPADRPRRAEYLMRWSVWRRPKHQDRALNTPPQVAAFKIVLFKHAVDHPRRLDDRIVA